MAVGAGARVPSEAFVVLCTNSRETMTLQDPVLPQLYRRALRGVPGLGTPSEAARRVRTNSSSATHATNRLRRRYGVLSGLTGFVCGLPGYAMMPVTIPSNVAGVLLLQCHMCATMAALADLSPEREAVRTDALQSVLNGFENEAEEINEGIGSLFQHVGLKIGERGLRFVSEQAVRWTGHGARRLPVLGGVLGAYADHQTTRNVWERARDRYFGDLA